MKTLLSWVKTEKQAGHILIRIQPEDEYIKLEVIDNGLGIKPEKLEEIRYNLMNSVESEHYGLYNINERLKLTFKNNYHISIESKYKYWTKVLLKIPMICGDPNVSSCHSGR